MIEGLGLSAALDEHLVLFFADQPLRADQQRDVAARSGPLYIHRVYPGEQSARESWSWNMTKCAGRTATVSTRT